MKALVVGGAGYIGSTTVQLLIETGHQVVVCDSLVSGHASAVDPQAQLVIADCRDEEAMDKLFASHEFDAVMHYGGYIEAGESMRQPGRYFANNIGGVITILNHMVTYSVNRFVFSSSAAVYGEPENTPVCEDAPVRPLSPYGESKAAVERLLSWYESRCGLSYASLRYFNAAGATETQGEDHRPETHLIPIALQVALGQRDALSLFGRDYPTPDGTCIRDYIHVSDLARAHILALEHLGKEGAQSDVFNLGNGKGFSNLEVIEAVRKVTGKKIALRDEARREGDPVTLVASADRAGAELGWTPAITSLEEIVESAWRWSLANPSGYKE